MIKDIGNDLLNKDLFNQTDIPALKGELEHIQRFIELQLMDVKENLFKKAKFNRIEEKYTPYKLIREVTPKECHWLERVYSAGGIVYKYYGTAYNCIGKNGTAFCEIPDQGPFFELPNDAVTIAK